MSDLSDFEDEYFDIVVNPVSNLFVKDVHLVWNEVSRVLKNKRYSHFWIYKSVTMDF